MVVSVRDRSFGETTMNEIPELAGEPYTDVLRRMHDVLRPQTYFEIGTSTGTSLTLAACRSVAVDPQFQLQVDVVNAKPACMLFQMTSDAFFRGYSPSALFGQPIDMAFLDGGHWAEFLLRDFANTEKHCNKNSIIFMHDCIPIDTWMTGRDIDGERSQSRYPGWWTGDVWKALVALKAYRPDLSITALDAAWTGLIAITSLDPSSRVLDDKYFEITSGFAGQTLEEYGIERYVAELDVQSTARLQTFEDISRYFWI
jgi:hypothetical protein